VVTNRFFLKLIFNLRYYGDFLKSNELHNVIIPYLKEIYSTENAAYVSKLI
jgi:hypothetical protein